jgi:hypothetical protein
MAPRQRSLSSSPATEESFDSTSCSDPLLQQQQQQQQQHQQDRRNNNSKNNKVLQSKSSSTASSSTASSSASSTTVAPTEADIAIAQHDYFNLVALVCYITNYRVPIHACLEMSLAWEY